ncbi:tyrosine-protein phosphatase [Virgibacillus sp. DJP39]|uniref:tyrosine-protein phosphatase n=1 Tax=Virgibacillus sp. DJP39 TaxID=3409790 RepID=UPI003BB58377
MIDINCHILPGMGDGSKSLTETYKMAEIAAQQGITQIIATPHHENGDDATSADNILAAVDYLNSKLIQEGVPLTILPGQVTRVYGEILDGIQSGEVLPLNKTSEYILIDLPKGHVPSYLTQLQFDMQIAGYKPIIAHPERNQELFDNPDKLYRMVKNGALIQITAASLVGKTGKKVQKFVHQMIEANLVHFIASEAQAWNKRSFFMKEASDIVRSEYGNATLHQFIENGQCVIDNLTIAQGQPERIKTKKGFRIFG